MEAAVVAQAADGREIWITLLGDSEGLPLVVLPGGPCRDPEYLGDLAGLAEVRPLAILHVRGTSRTGGTSSGWWSDAADAVAALDRLGLDSADVLAHSAGTRLALSLVAQHPARVRSLALITPPSTWLSGVEYDGAALVADRAEPEVAQALASMLGPDPADEDEFQRAWEREQPAGYGHWTERERRHAPVGGMALAPSAAWFDGIPADARERILRAPLPPTLVVGGALDILTGVAPVRAYAEHLGAELAMIPDSGHYPWVEQPTAFRRVIDPWATATR
ncbi:alpha/beta fold hydrolase [Microbacterium sp. NPDC090225]|uniref:alpha/beta fold hydrolase n=1 Tax=Microbacterium sp. NPDC090225 TaxID=3364207 RepID=UPI00380D2B3A